MKVNISSISINDKQIEIKAHCPAGIKLLDEIFYKEMVNEFQGNRNPFKSFVEQCCVLNGAYDSELLKLYNVYKLWCKRNNYKKLSKTNFGRQILKIPHVELGLDYSKDVIFVGLKLSSRVKFLQKAENSK